MATVISVNLAVPRPDPGGTVGRTGIDKRPVSGPVLVGRPDSKGVGGLAGDRILDAANHGGEHQAVYAYAREDLDLWQAELGRPLSGGVFGENLTTAGLEVTGALIGERWRIGEVVLEVSAPRIPCGTFARWMAEPDWIKLFTRRNRPGAYLRVIVPGAVRAGDPITVAARPDHDVTVGMAFAALTTQPRLLPRLLAATALPPDTRARVARRTAARTP